MTSAPTFTTCRPTIFSTVSANSYWWFIRSPTRDSPSVETPALTNCVDGKTGVNRVIGSPSWN